MLKAHRLWLFFVTPGVLSACDEGRQVAHDKSMQPEAAVVDKSNPNWKQQLDKTRDDGLQTG